MLHLGPVSLPLWLMFVGLAVIRHVLYADKLRTKGGSLMNKLNTVLFSLTGFAEMVWDIGAKVVAGTIHRRFSQLLPL